MREDVGLKQHLLVLATYTKLMLRYIAAGEVGDCVSKRTGSEDLPR